MSGNIDKEKLIAMIMSLLANREELESILLDPTVYTAINHFSKVKTQSAASCRELLRKIDVLKIGARQFRGYKKEDIREWLRQKDG